MDKSESLYKEYLDGKYEPVVLAIVEQINGSDGELNYMHDRMLTPRFSVNGKWETLSADYHRVSADFVAQDSELPLKKRDSLAKASGDIVKSGMEMKLNEQQMQEIDLMFDLKADVQQIMAKLTEDSAKCIAGMKELTERAFLEALSTGQTLITDSENTGIGIRLDFGYKDENKFNSNFVWEDKEKSTPLDDIEKVIDAATAQGKALRHAWMSKKTWKQFRDSKQVISYTAGRNYYAGDISAYPKSTLADINGLLVDDDTYGITIHVIDRSVEIEKNGVRKFIKPWKEGMVVFTATENVGDLVWANVAESKRKIPGVTYQSLSNGVLLSKFSVNRPTLAEFTQIQGRLVPVINGGANIFQLDTINVNEDDAEDGNITLWDQTYTKAKVLGALKSVNGIDLPSTTKESTIVQIINGFNRKVQSDIKTALDASTSSYSGGEAGEGVTQ